jgi:hypothetical protein
MSPILTAHCAIEFQYGEAAKYSSFEVVFAEFGTRKRIAKKLPLSTSSSDMWALVSSEMACKKSPTVVTQEQLLWHCSVYERNIYYLRTLLHDSKLHSCVAFGVVCAVVCGLAVGLDHMGARRGARVA